MGDAYNRRIYQGAQRQEWMNSPPQYFPTQGVDPFGISGGSYMGPGMGRPPGNMGPPMPPGVFQHHQPAAFHLPPPGAIPSSNMPYRTPASIAGGRGGILPQIRPYGNHQGNAVLSPL